MSTTITPSDFTSSLTDNLSLNTRDFGSSNTYTQTDCTEADHRIVNVALKADSESAATWTELFYYDTSNQQGQAILTEFEYVRLTNLDNTNYCIVQFEMNVANTFLNIKLGAGQSFMLQNSNIVVSTSAAPATGYLNFRSIKKIRAAADTAACNIEIVTVFKPAS